MIVELYFAGAFPKNYLGPSFWPYRTITVEPPEPPAPPDVAKKKSKGSGAQTREQAWRAQEELAIAEDDRELLSLVARLMEELDP